MKKAKNKYYVVWEGHQTGIFDTWEKCRKQVDGYTAAKYKGFPSIEEAKAAMVNSPWNYFGKTEKAPVSSEMRKLYGEPLQQAICVDAACKGNPGILEYRGVDTKSGAELFRQGPFPHGTVNIGEFLAVVHALAYLNQRKSTWPIYSDSRTAISWVKKKAIKTNLQRTANSELLFSLVDRALNWLRDNSYPNKVIKWQTEFWGEIPADFGRK